MLIEVKEKNDKIKKLISYCIGYPKEEKINKKIEEYFTTEDLKLYCTPDFLGIIGVRLFEDKKIEISHIAVVPEKRKKNIGMKMINEIALLPNCSELFLETDDSAVGFYQKCGFTVKNLGEKYPGVIRYYCEKSIRINGKKATGVRE